MKATKQEGYRWVVNCTIGGKRHRKFFRHGEKEQAEAYAKSLTTEAENLATKDAALLAGNEQLPDVAWALRKLDPYGKTLRDAVEYYVGHLEANERSCSVAELVEQVCLSKEREGLSERYLRDLRQRLGRFKEDFAERPVASITTVEISDWMANLPDLSAVSRLNYRRLIVLLFNEGLRRKVCNENPAKYSEKPKIVEGEVGILTVQQASALLENCSDTILPATAIGLFAGLRTSEIERLDWKEIDLEEGHILVLGPNAKSARRRYVNITDNLVKWLSPRRERKGKVVSSPREWRTLREEARIVAELGEWPHNALRHSYASYHLAKHKDIGRLTDQLGHTSPQMVFQHYRNIVKPAEAERYWKIAPATAAKFAKKKEKAA